MAYQPVDVFIKDTSPLHAPISGVVVSVYSATGAQLITQSTTDNDGHSGFLLNEGLHQLRFAKFGVGFSVPQYIEVSSSNNVFDVPGNLVVPPVSNDARLCVAYGFFRDVTGAPAAFTNIHFISKFKPVLLEGSAVLTERVSVRTDERGYAQINLIRFGKYDVTIAGFEDYQRCIEVPDAPNVNLPDLLFPVIQSVVFDPPIPSSMDVGDPDFQTTPSAIRSDGNVLDGPHSCEAIQFSSSDSDILGLLIAGGVITLRPLSVGTASLKGVRNENTIVRIPDLGIQGLPVSVVIS